MAFSYYVSLWGNYSCAMGQRLVALRTSSIILTSQFQKTFHLLKHKMKRLSDFTLNFHFHALEKEMATHSSVLAWRIPGTGEPGGLPSMGLHRVGHDWSDFAAAAAAIPRSRYRTCTDPWEASSGLFLVNTSLIKSNCLSGFCFPSFVHSWIGQKWDFIKCSFLYVLFCSYVENTSMCLFILFLLDIRVVV